MTETAQTQMKRGRTRVRSAGPGTSHANKATRKPGRLFVSFWNICLDNLPEGAFRRRRITSDHAKRYIERARQGNRLLCLSDDDLLAPYQKHARENHKALCRVLTEHFGIALSLRDFMSKHEADGDPCYSVNPLSCARVSGHNQLLVVTCLYVFGTKSKGKTLPLEIDPATVEFQMIEPIRLP